MHNVLVSQKDLTTARDCSLTLTGLSDAQRGALPHKMASGAGRVSHQVLRPVREGDMAENAEGCK